MVQGWLRLRQTASQRGHRLARSFGQRVNGNAGGGYTQRYAHTKRRCASSVLYVQQQGMNALPLVEFPKAHRED